MSEVQDKFSAGEMPNSWLLGDSGYPLCDWLLTPYHNPVGEGQIRYNESHKETRSGIQRCIGLLLLKFILVQCSKAEIWTIHSVY